MLNHPRAIFSIKVSRAETKLDFNPGCEKSDKLTYRVGVSSVQKVSPALDKLVQNLETIVPIQSEKGHTDVTEE